MLLLGQNADLLGETLERMRESWWFQQPALLILTTELSM